MKKRLLQAIAPILTAAIFLSACAEFDTPSVTGNEKEDEIVSLGLTPEFDYEVPRSIPDIMVNQVGYAQDSKKIAVFRGEMLPDTYNLVNAETGEIVYTGEIEPKGYNETTDENISYGDFTDYTVSGIYYLQADVIGQSYLFAIEKNPYAAIFTEALKQYYYNRCGLTLSMELAKDTAHNACHTKSAQLKDDTAVQIDVLGGWHSDEKGNRDVTEGCEAVNSLLLAYELYGGIFTDDIGIPESGNGIPDVLDEVKYEVDWLLKMQDSASGAVYSAVGVIDNPDADYLLYVEPATMNTTAQFAAAMAKFSYLYQGYDRDFATQCLRAADRAYRYVEQYPETIPQEEYFYAATELYRATGSNGYHSTISKYLSKTGETDIDNDYVFLGCVTYLSTKQKVDVTLCDKAITDLLAAVEKISYNSKNSKYLTEANAGQSNNSELLKKMTRLAVVDHIITNHEYMTVLENHLHYFLGRNAQSASYIDSAANRNSKSVDSKINIMNQMEQNAQLVLLLSVIEENLEE